MSVGPNVRRTELSSVRTTQARSIAKTYPWLMLVISTHTTGTPDVGMYLSILARRCPTNLTVGRDRLVTDLALSQN